MTKEATYTKSKKKMTLDDLAKIIQEGFALFGVKVRLPSEEQNVSKNELSTNR